MHLAGRYPLSLKEDLSRVLCMPTLTQVADRYVEYAPLLSPFAIGYIVSRTPTG